MDLTEAGVLDATRSIRATDGVGPAWDAAWQWWVQTPREGVRPTHARLAEIVKASGLTSSQADDADDLAAAMDRLARVSIDPEHVVLFATSPLADGTVLAICAAEYVGDPQHRNFYSTVFRVMGLAQPDSRVDTQALAVLAGLRGYTLPALNAQGTATCLTGAGS